MTDDGDVAELSGLESGHAAVPPRLDDSGRGILTGRYAMS
jgi:hypothetical protein